MEDSGSSKKEMNKDKEVKMKRNSTRQLKAMLRKNWLLKIRHPVVTLTEVITFQNKWFSFLGINDRNS